MQRLRGRHAPGHIVIKPKATGVSIPPLAGLGQQGTQQVLCMAVTTAICIPKEAYVVGV